MPDHKQYKNPDVKVVEATPLESSGSFFERLIIAIRAQYDRRLLLPLTILIFVLVGGSAVLYHIGHTTPSANANPASSAHLPPPFPPAFLVFQNLQGGPPATNATTTIVRLDGSVVHQITSDYTSSAFDEYAGSMGNFSSGLLLSNQLSDGTNKSVTKWSVLHDDGRLTTVASTLTATLNNLWDNNDIISSPLFLVGSNTLYGLFANSQTYNLQEMNLQTGVVQTVLQFKPLNGSLINNDIQLKTMDANQTEVSLVLNNVSVNGKHITAPSVGVYHFGTRVLTSTPLPSRFAGIAPTGETQAPQQFDLSADGTLLAYQVQSQGPVHGTQTTIFTTHVYNTQTGTDVTVSSSTSISLGACAEAFYFSNDDKYLVTCGSTSLDGNAIVEAASTKTGAVVKTLTEGSTNNYDITMVGWSQADGLVYVTNTAASGSTFNDATEVAHRINLTTGAQSDYPSGLGELLMVLH